MEDLFGLVKTKQKKTPKYEIEFFDEFNNSEILKIVNSLAQAKRWINCNI